MLITPSGADKSSIADTDLLQLTWDGFRLLGSGTPSAETALHIVLYETVAPRVIVHSHSRANTVLSRRFLPEGKLVLEGYELLKALSGVSTHLHREELPILANSQEMNSLSNELQTILPRYQNVHGFLLAGHGLYTWGSSTDEAFRHLEALEFLFEVRLAELSLQQPGWRKE